MNQKEIEELLQVVGDMLEYFDALSVEMEGFHLRFIDSAEETVKKAKEIYDKHCPDSSVG